MSPATSSHDYYRTLGIAPAADASAVKRAYRTRAKAVHPDAGGSAESMEQLNEAYRVLSDPFARSQYDRTRGEGERLRRPEAPHRAAPTRPATHPVHRSEPHRPEPVRRSAPMPDPYQEIRLTQARWSAWRILKSATTAAIITNLITRFLAAQPDLEGLRPRLALIGFLPIYAMVVGIIFMINPELRLALHDLGHNLISRRHRRVDIPSADLWGLLVLALSSIPMAALWVAFFA